jgi:phosphatidylglycerophosphatase A
VSDRLTLGSAFYIGFGYSMRRLLASCFGLGWLPLAPGTWGSLPPAIVFALMCHFGASAVLIAIAMAALAFAGSVVCVKFSPAIIAATDKIDPPEVVADEFAGQALMFLGVLLLTADTFSTKQLWVIAGLGFLLFRLFDIIKIWPINVLQKLPQGWGILVDDLLAGLYAAITLMICLRLWAVFSSG